MDGLPLKVHALNLVFALGVLFSLDTLVVTPIVVSRATKKDHKNARWFFIHALGNAMVVRFAL